MSLSPSAVLCRTASGERLHILGEVRASIKIDKLRRDTSWVFIVADIPLAIIGLDFLSHFKLVIDCDRRELIDSVTGRRVRSTTSKASLPSLSFAVPDTTHPVIQSLLDKYPSLLAPIQITKPSASHTVFHRIETGDSSPTVSRARRLPPDKLAIVKKEFSDLLAAGIIRPSTSNWSSPLHLVKKKDGGYRPCGDFRALNSVSKDDRYPLPIISSLSSTLHGAAIFSKLDLKKAYHLIPVHPNDVHKTATIVPFGLFEFLTVPFGLRGAASTFQRFMDAIFRGIEGVFIYLDDILVFTKTEDEHATLLSKVFSILAENNLRLSFDKCLFFQSSLTYLGFDVSSSGLGIPSHRKCEIKNFPLPKDAPALRRFIGLMNFYRRLLPCFANIMFPITELMRFNQKSKSLSWPPDALKAFNDIKQAVADSTVLPFAFPSSDSLFLVTDASGFAAGAALHQVIEGNPVPIDFFSKKFNDIQRRYSAFDRELLAAYLAVLHFKDFLEGRKVVLFTDHKPLVHALRSKRPATLDRQQRHLSVILEYVSSFEYVAGADNVVADALSRPDIDFLHDTTTLIDSPGSSATVSQSATVAAVILDAADLSGIARAQSTDTEIKGYTDRLQPFPLYDKTILLCDTSTVCPRPFVPKTLRRTIFNDLHNLSHPGVKPSLRLIKSRYFWPGIDHDVRAWAKECHPCQVSKIQRHTRSPVLPFDMPCGRFETVHIDLVGPLPPVVPPSSHAFFSYSYLLTCIDRSTNWVEVIPVPDISAKAVAYAFLSGWISRFGVPLYVLTDRGQQFESEFFAELSSMVGFHRLRTSSYHPQTNSKLERFHRVLKTSLKARGSNWLLSLPLVLLALRSMPNEEGVSPFLLVTGKSPFFPLGLLDHPPTTVSLGVDFITRFVSRMRELDFRIPPPLHTNSIPSYIPKELDTCTHVYVRVDRIRKPLEAPYQGPFKILKRNKKCFRLLFPSGSTDVVSIDRLKPAVLPSVPDTSSSTDTPSQQTVPLHNNLSSDSSIVSPQTAQVTYPNEVPQQVDISHTGSGVSSDLPVPVSSVEDPLATGMKLRSGKSITFHPQPAIKYVSRWISP